MRKFLSSFFLLLASIQKIQGAFIENGEFRVVCGKQNHLRTRRKNQSVHGEDAKTHKTVYISANNTN
jgi:hypothetical protein